MYKSLPLWSFPVFPFINMHNWETASYILFSAKNSYINKTNTHIHKVEVKSLYFNFVWLTELRFLLSISRKWKTIEVSDHTFYGFTGVITYFGCWENTRKACKSLAFGSWFTSFSRVLPTFRVGYHAGKPIESVVYILINYDLSMIVSSLIFRCLGFLSEHVWDHALAAVRWFLPLHIVKQARTYDCEWLLHGCWSDAGRCQSKRMESERQRIRLSKE